MMVIAIIIGIAAVVLIAGYTLMRYYPAFGGKQSKQKRRVLSRSANYAKDKFANQSATSMNTSFIGTVKILIEFIKGNPKGRPDKPLAVEPLRAGSKGESQQAKVTWLGHSALLLEMEGKVLLLDPMLGRAPSPFPLIGGKRYSKPVQAEELPAIDAVLISHDHYDHLDYGSIKRLKHKVKHFFVPLGVGTRLEQWGVAHADITELDWWDEVSFEGLVLASTPARHFSGRSLLDRDSTLWCSWVIQGKQTRVFFSGDSGYGPHFEQIGHRYGPFDLALMECGQYDARWSAIHMMPEETVQAHLDVRGGLMIPIHWGAFTLALHDWTDPVERVSAAAKERGAALATPRIGETVLIGATDYPTSAWWK